ncbi:MAG TPA: carbohydrate-binding family 9-like protein, partial [Syntrophorhabdaceae bacterium]|nr:carbohydrate-binding family 9-like protein [Syntrophorhabdaceae bacterium]
MDSPVYTIRKTTRDPLRDSSSESLWEKAQCLTIGCFRPEGTSHRPTTRCRLLYDDDLLYGSFAVEDRYVRCLHTHNQSPVYEDSCVELFLQPLPDGGYFSFEFNCGGAILSSYITDPTKIEGRVAGAVPIEEKEISKIELTSSLPGITDPEIAAKITWTIEFSVPFALFEYYIGKLEKEKRREWRGNFYKCGDKTSHPHWASWA